MARIASRLVATLALISLTACAGVKGNTTQEKRNAVPQMRRDALYQITETGLALQATVRGTKALKDDELN